MLVLPATLIMLGEDGAVVSMVLEVVPDVKLRVIAAPALVNVPSTKLPAAHVTSPLSPESVV